MRDDSYDQVRMAVEEAMEAVGPLGVQRISLETSLEVLKLQEQGKVVGGPGPTTEGLAMMYGIHPGLVLTLVNLGWHLRTADLLKKREAEEGGTDGR
jgi:hypothetical protein